MTITVALVGAGGTMGRLISQIIDSEPGFEVVAKLGSSSPLSDMVGADVAVDVTRPGVSQSVVDFAIENGLSVLVGTSGWSGDRIAALERRVAELAEIGVVIVPNFSLGSVLATRFATMAARFYDSIEIVESHHAGKVDSPSGTAVRTAELIAAARRELGPVAAPHVDQRARGQQVASIPVHSLRMQGVVARQDVIFGGTGEMLTLSHETISSSAYDRGIRIALNALSATRGVTVGLDALLGLEAGDDSAVANGAVHDGATIPQREV